MGRVQSTKNTGPLYLVHLKRLFEDIKWTNVMVKYLWKKNRHAILVIPSMIISKTREIFFHCWLECMWLLLPLPLNESGRRSPFFFFSFFFYLFPNCNHRLKLLRFFRSSLAICFIWTWTVFFFICMYILYLLFCDLLLVMNDYNIHRYVLYGIVEQSHKTTIDLNIMIYLWLM